MSTISLSDSRRGGIIPPHILERLQAADDEHLARCAETTRRTDRTLLGADAPGPADLLADPDPPSGPARRIYDAQHRMQLPGTLARRENEPDVADREVNEAYDALGATYRFYLEVFGRRSIDDRGLALLGSVHYGQDYMNAFWNGQQMVFGDGDGVIFRPFTRSLDVVAHELTHGVTQNTARLVYQGQSGALNESVSDVFGALTEQYAAGQRADEASWLIGAALLTERVQGRALRDMAHPGTAYDDPRLGQDPQPADMAHYVETRADNGGVHINSGIPNRAFYLAAIGLGGTSWSVAGALWYATLSDPRLPADADFSTFAGVTVARAAADHGADAARIVQQAWQGVGVDA